MLEEKTQNIYCVNNRESKKGRMENALALKGDEGRDKLR